MFETDLHSHFQSIVQDKLTGIFLAFTIANFVCKIDTPPVPRIFLGLTQSFFSLSLNLQDHWTN